MDIISLYKQLRTHIGYYRITRRFSKLDLPKLTREEKRLIRKTWSGIHILDIDFFNSRVYKKLHGFSPYYLSPCWYNEYRDMFNPSRQLYALENKALCDIYFPEIKFPKVYVRCLNGHFYDESMNMLSKEKAIESLNSYNNIIIKPSLGSNQGKGVLKVSITDKHTDLNNLLSQYGRDFIIQEVIPQAPEISRLNPTSLNCFRVTTMLLNGHIGYSTMLKVGKAGSFKDNWNSAYCINVLPNGELDQFGYDYNFKRVEHTDNGINFKGLIMPKYNEMISELLRLHSKYFPNCGVIGWDVTIDTNYEVRVIETNLCDPGTDAEQLVSGDFFKEFHKDILSYTNK